MLAVVATLAAGAAAMAALEAIRERWVWQWVGTCLVMLLFIPWGLTYWAPAIPPALVVAGAVIAPFNGSRKRTDLGIPV
ncbi:MAG: hypothetical protein M5U22_13000 [Thermoleophilia bacterium]|nr:hypothetical protein [Thermoleophilia bacterium]